GSPQAVGVIPGLVVAGYVVEAGTAPVVVVDAPRNPVNTSGWGPAEMFASTIFNGSWPAAVRVSAAVSAWAEVGDWKLMVAAPVRSVSIAMAAGGAQLGTLITRDNGTGRLHLLRAPPGSSW